MGVKLSTRNFDARGMTVGRVIRQHLLGKARPLWCFSDGLELKHVLALAIRHYAGYPAAYLTTRYESQWKRLLGFWRRCVARGKRGEADPQAGGP